MNVVKTIFIDYNCVHLLCLVPEINVIIIIIIIIIIKGGGHWAGQLKNQQLGVRGPKIAQQSEA